MKNKKNINRYHQLDKNYYLDALARVSTEAINPVFSIISDQPDLAKEVLYDKVFDQFNLEFRSGDAWEDFVTLAGSRSIVASNSTYCWWASAIAQQSAHLKQLVAPRDWFQPGFRHLDAPDYKYIGEQTSELLFSAL